MNAFIVLYMMAAITIYILISASAVIMIEQEPELKDDYNERFVVTSAFLWPFLFVVLVSVIFAQAIRDQKS